MKKIINSKKLNKKELTFCYHYVESANIKQSAILAGYKNNPEKKGLSLIFDTRICDKIESIYKEKRKNLMYRAIIGYERLAFGNIHDSIKLIFSENLNNQKLEKMDLFNISEIKKPKDDSMEIKFFDRLRALEKLEEIQASESSNKEPFYYALENSVKKLSNLKNSNLEE